MVSSCTMFMISGDPGGQGGQMWGVSTAVPWGFWPGPRAAALCSVLQHSFDGILQWAIQSMSRPLAEAPTFPS